MEQFIRKEIGGPMKKGEAQMLAPIKSQIIIQYINQVLLYPEAIQAKINLGVAKLEKQNVCVLDIYVPKMDMERHLNLEITMDHYFILCRQLLIDLLKTFSKHETIQLSDYYSIKSMIENFAGIDAMNAIGSRIRMNLNISYSEFQEIMDAYNTIYDTFPSEMESHPKVK